MSALLDELISGPLADEVAPYIVTGNDGEIERILNEKRFLIRSTISANTFAIWAASTGLRATIQDHAENVQSPLRSIALTLLDLLQGNLDRALDFGNAANVAMLGAWVSEGAITTIQRDELLVLSQKMISRAEQLGINPTIADIAQALRG